MDGGVVSEGTPPPPPPPPPPHPHSSISKSPNAPLAHLGMSCAPFATAIKDWRNGSDGRLANSDWTTAAISDW
jgi:hypothetical protein